jgi:hypothetical protein
MRPARAGFGDTGESSGVGGTRGRSPASTTGLPILTTTSRFATPLTRGPPL